MMIVFSLSARKVKDEYIIIFGSVLSIIGYFLVWDLWRWETAPGNFVLPIIIGIAGSSYVAAPTRSVFTKAVDNIKVLRDHQGTMQALLSMCSSVAGFATPGLVAAYVLRSPEEVEHSRYHRELNPYALFAPLMMVGVLAGSIYMVTIRNDDKPAASATKDQSPSESTNLLSTAEMPAEEP